MMELKEGVWMAQGASQNVIIKVIGEKPFIRIVKGIYMNDFYTKGKVKELDEDSIEIQHILQNPSNYTFEKLTVTQAVLDTIGIGTTCFQKYDSIEDIDIKEITEEYKNYIELYGNRGDSAFIIKLCKKYGITVGQSRNLLENKIKRLLKFQY